MKIALLGMGRMGKTIEKLASAQGHEIVYKTSGPVEAQRLGQAEVAIEFSIAEAAFDNISLCLEAGVPVVSGTTGWLDQYEAAVKLCQEKNGAFLYASNFSIGVHLFFELNNILAGWMKNFKAYRVSIEETHHTGKRDQPSGTAISLAEDIIQNSFKTHWELTESPSAALRENTIPIIARRKKDVKGTHIVQYQSAIDAIEIKHTAHSREGFASGALLAAAFLVGRKGVFSMKEILKDLI